MIKKMIKNRAKKIALKVIDKIVDKCDIIDKDVIKHNLKHKEPIVAGFKWTAKNQKLLLDLMDKVPQNDRTYH